MSAASKAIAALLRDSAEWRAFSRQCCETSPLRLRSQAWQWRDELAGRGQAFELAELEDVLMGLARKVFPESPAAQWDADHASALCKDALARLGEHFAGLSEAERDRLDLSGQGPREEAMLAAGHANDPEAFRVALRGWERTGLEALAGARNRSGAA